MFTLTRKYNDLITFCFREQKRRQDAEELAATHKSDAVFWKDQCAVYKARAERLEHEQRHPRRTDGQYRRVIPIKQGAAR